ELFTLSAYSLLRIKIGERMMSLRSRLAACGQDRCIAGAAAQIAGQSKSPIFRIELATFGMLPFQQAGHRHDKAGRAITALRAVVRDHRLLHRRELSMLLQAFDRDDVCAI